MSPGPSTADLEQLAVLAVDDTLVDPDRRAVLDPADVVGTRLEQQHAGVREELGTERRVAAGDERCAVQDRDHAVVEQRAGRGCVEVGAVHHRDLTGPQPGCQ